jgi:hypothetical protein
LRRLSALTSFTARFKEIKARNTDIDPEDLQALIDDTVAEVRAERVNRKSRKA